MAQRYWDNGNNRSSEQRQSYGQQSRRDYQRGQGQQYESSGRFESGIEDEDAGRESGDEMRYGRGGSEQGGYYGSSGNLRDFEDRTSGRGRDFRGSDETRNYDRGGFSAGGRSRDREYRRQYGRQQVGESGSFGMGGSQLGQRNQGFGYGREEQFGAQRYGLDDDFSSEGTDYRGYGSEGGFSSQGSYGYQPGQYGYGSQGSQYGQRSQPGRQSERQSFRGRGPRGYQRSDDRLKEMICEFLTDDPDIDATEITIVVTGGEVTLDGSVSDRQTKYRVEDAVSDIGGVKEVRNNLRVQGSGGMGSSAQSSSRSSAGSQGTSGSQGYQIGGQQTGGNGGSGRSSSLQSEDSNKDKSKKSS